MKAMLVKDGKLLFTDVEMPSVKDDEIRIKIKAIGINRADLLQKKGTYPSPKGWPEWPGLEVSGIVDAMGENAKQKWRKSHLFDIWSSNHYTQFNEHKGGIYGIL